MSWKRSIACQESSERISEHGHRHWTFSCCNWGSQATLFVGIPVKEEQQLPWTTMFGQPGTGSDHSRSFFLHKKLKICDCCLCIVHGGRQEASYVVGAKYSCNWHFSSSAVNFLMNWIWLAFYLFFQHLLDVDWQLLMEQINFFFERTMEQINRREKWPVARKG